MSTSLEQIFLFQKKLNKYARLNEADKVLYYIHKLNYLNVTVSHLEETGVGKTVNALRHQGGKVGEKARGLVNKWKEMVTAEEEEEEEEDAGENEEEHHQEGGEGEEETRGSGREAVDEQYNKSEEEEEDEEENCLQIEENTNPMEEEEEEEREEEEEESERPTSPGYGLYDSPHIPTDPHQYNPLTSQRDYQNRLAIPTTEYHPTSGLLTPRADSSPELPWDMPSPEPPREHSSPPPKKNSREEKDRSQERDKRSKGKSKRKERDRSESHERERKKEKHRDKHRERKEEKPEERKEEVEEERKSKSHKDKHRDRDKHHHQHRSKENKHKTDKTEDSSRRSKHEKSGDSGSSSTVVNGFNTPDPKDRASRREKEVKERIGEEAEEGKAKEGGKERDRESGKKDKNKRERKSGEEDIPGRHRKEKKNKHDPTADMSDGKNKHKEEKQGKQDKRKHKESSSKKDKHKHDVSNNSSSSKDREEQEHSSHNSSIDSSSSSSKKKKSSKQEMDSGFGAVLMGLDSPVKKKKKKKKKEVEKVHESLSEGEEEEEEQPSTSGGYKRERGGLGGGGMPENKRPKLLSASKDRLPALPSLDVMDEKPLLPEITPHYKPLPRLPIREDRSPESSLAKMTEEEALNFVFQSKNNRRSKVYSGKVTGLAYVPSLYEICIRVLQENIDAMEFTGGVPFDILRPVLDRASPKQLLTLEDYNPYLLEDSGLLWETHCKRDFKKEKLLEMETWREMWLRCSDERDRKLRNLTHNLTEKFLTKAEPKRTTKIAYIDGPAKVPKGVARAQAKYGTAAASALAAKPGKANEVAARKTAMQNVQRAERAANPRPVAAKKKKVAPLMAKTRQFFKKAFRR